MTAEILIVDDDSQIRDVVKIALSREGYRTASAADGMAALTRCNEHTPDLVVLDIGLPEMDGLAVCREIRKTSDVPIIFLTARDEEVDRIVGLELGADDYVSKPFSPRELVARIKAVLKRTNAQANSKPVESLSRGQLLLDVSRHECSFGKAQVPLTRSEMILLEALMQRPENVLSRPQLADALYGTNIHISDRTIDSHLRNMRRKLTDAGCPDALATVHGVGVRMGACQGG